MSTQAVNDRCFTLDCPHGWTTTGPMSRHLTVVRLMSSTATFVNGRAAWPFEVIRKYQYGAVDKERTFVSLFWNDGMPVNGGDYRIVDKAPPVPVENHRTHFRVRHAAKGGPKSTWPSAQIQEAFRSFKNNVPDLQPGEEIEITIRTVRPIEPKTKRLTRTVMLDHKREPLLLSKDRVERMVRDFLVNFGHWATDVRVSIEGEMPNTITTRE